MRGVASQGQTLAVASCASVGASATVGTHCVAPWRLGCLWFWSLAQQRQSGRPHELGTGVSGSPLHRRRNVGRHRGGSHRSH